MWLYKTSDLLKRLNWYEIIYDRIRKRWPFNTGDHTDRFDCICIYIMFAENQILKWSCENLMNPEVNLYIYICAREGSTCHDFIKTPTVFLISSRQVKVLSVTEERINLMQRQKIYCHLRNDNFVNLFVTTA